MITTTANDDANSNVDDDHDTYGNNQINRRIQSSEIFRSVQGAVGLMERTSARNGHLQRKVTV